MAAPSVAPEDIFITIIFIMATVVVVIMFLVSFVFLRMERKTKNEIQPKVEDEPGPGRSGKIFPGGDTVSVFTGAVKRQPLKTEAPSVTRKLSGLFSFLKQKRRDVAGIFWVMIFFLLLSAQFILQLSLEKGWTTYSEPAATSLLAVDHEGRVWAVGQESLIHYPKHGEPIRIPLPDLNDPFMSDSVLSVAFDRQGRVWMSTVNGRLAVWDSINQWKFYNPESLEGPMLGPAIRLDGEGQVWTNAAELASVELDHENNIYRLKGAGLGVIDTFTIDPQGQLWVLRAKGEVQKQEPGGSWVTVATATKEDPLVNWAFSSYGQAHLMIDRQGWVWIGVNNGIIHVLDRGGVWQIHTPEEPHTAIYSSGLVVDHLGNLWGVSGDQGLYRFHPETGWTAYNERNSGLANRLAYALAVDGRGHIWMGTYGAGLTKMDPAEALSPRYVPILGTLAAIVLPSVLISMLVVAAMLILMPRLRGNLRITASNFSKIVLGILGAGVGGLFVLGQREGLAAQIFETLFGTYWSHNDLFAMIGAPLLSICLVPLIAVLGAGLGVFVVQIFFWVVRSRE